jgi:hypothetical protein
LSLTRRRVAHCSDGRRRGTSRWSPLRSRERAPNAARRPWAFSGLFSAPRTRRRLRRPGLRGGCLQNLCIAGDS